MSPDHPVGAHPASARPDLGAASTTRWTVVLSPTRQPYLSPRRPLSPEFSFPHRESQAYRRELLGHVLAEEHLQQRWRRLLARSEPPLLHAVLDESCIRRPIGGTEVMTEQLSHLEDVSASSRIIIQVSPFGLGEEAPFRASMTLLSFADRTVVGYSESLERGYVVRTPGTVAAWEEDYHRLQVEALSKRASQAMIRKAREDLTL
ncbi:DUF5753 domain-containing protein [Kitasatospora purpeofusca]|uniref:DUF5753 domain-containing protein n=1 Tax=Kitasatospora purpeofusca TaxID=67352 RepID=UPI00386D4B11|nr:DUF5753 domain-containing protein [Kitasatospora purpeofusca]